MNYDYIFRWGNNPVRKKYKGKHCRVFARGKLGTVGIEFGDGHRMTTSRRALRKRIK